MFEHFSLCDLSIQRNMECFETIIATIDRHTLLTELIARQIAKSYLDLESAEAMIAGIGLSELPTEKIDYIHDQTAYHETVLRILDKLVEIDQFLELDKCCMKLLSLFNVPGIDGGLFKQLTGSTNLDLVNELETTGWLKRDGSLLYLHPMMQEYVRSWPWTSETVHGADKLMMKIMSFTG